MKRSLAAVVVAALSVLSIVTLRTCRERAIQEHLGHIKALEDRELQDQLDRVKMGLTHEIWFTSYTGSETDRKLESVMRMNELGTLVFDHTDLSDAGMARVSTQPSLRELGIFHCAVGDQGITAFRNNRSIEALALVNTDVSEGALDVLKTFRKLRVLVLWNRPKVGAPPFSARQLGVLRAIPSLSVVYLGGRWGASDDEQDLRELEGALGGADVKRLSAAPSSEDTLWRVTTSAIGRTQE